MRVSCTHTHLHLVSSALLILLICECVCVCVCVCQVCVCVCVRCVVLCVCVVCLSRSEAFTDQTVTLKAENNSPSCKGHSPGSQTLKLNLFSFLSPLSS